MNFHMKSDAMTFSTFLGPPPPPGDRWSRHQHRQQDSRRIVYRDVTTSPVRRGPSNHKDNNLHYVKNRFIVQQQRPSYPREIPRHHDQIHPTYQKEIPRIERSNSKNYHQSQPPMRSKSFKHPNKKSKRDPPREKKEEKRRSSSPEPDYFTLEKRPNVIIPRPDYN